MTAESRSLATALQRARVASGLLRPSYTIQRGHAESTVPGIFATSQNVCDKPGR